MIRHVYIRRPARARFCRSHSLRLAMFMFSWLVACCLVQATEDRRGRACDPHYVEPGQWQYYEGDHWPVADQCDCRLANLRPRAKALHRTLGRADWPTTSLPRVVRGMQRSLAGLLQARAKAKAKAKAKTTGKGRGKANGKGKGKGKSKCAGFSY